MENNLLKLVDLVHGTDEGGWNERHKEAFEGLFGGNGGRYKKDAEKGVRLRAPEMKGDSGVPFAAYVHEQNPTSGAYGGMSFVMFPAEGAPCLVGMVVGTQGLAPDEAILGRPGHARKVQAICAWLNRKYGGGAQVAWAKQDPTRIDLDVPDTLKSAWSEYQKVFARYGKVLYAVYRPGANREATLEAVTAMLDLTFEERGQLPLTAWAQDCRRIQGEWFECLMPATTEEGVADFLKQRRYVIVQGPPGTGKTRMALRLLEKQYGGFGRSVQFHPNTTYENFVGGLAPVQGGGELGLRFAPAKGFLMEAAAEALKDPDRDYLLHLDEINRADLGKILGEAIFLLEPSDGERRVDLAYDFGPPFGRTLWLPSNLHILGTMNTADRSIAIVDVAVRRRFGFLPLWPSMEVVQAHGGGLAREAFQRLTSIFVEHASEEALNLVPGHSYFLQADDGRARAAWRASPLLQPAAKAEVCLELRDHSVVERSAVRLFGLDGGRGSEAQAARLTEQFLQQNRVWFELAGVKGQRDYDGRDVWLRLESGNRVGAIPLVSPQSGRPEYGLVVQPRFPWAGIGPMLAEMGWRVAPVPLRLPLMRRSERRVPPWVLSFLVLARLRAFVKDLERRFEMSEATLRAPKGQVGWAEYATRGMARGRFLEVPCRYSDLRDDRRMKGAIRYAVEKQLRSLETQREQGSFVHRLMALGEEILCAVRDVTAVEPTAREMDGWLHRPLRKESWMEGLQAIDWTVEERGLAGLSDLDGLPWTLPMEEFFEAWVETVMREVSRLTGGVVRTGRERQTVTPIEWEPTWAGSQRSLVPDVVLQMERCTPIVDAKYKRHWEELEGSGWASLEDVVREQHRQDLLQVLAYANLAETEKVICCLMYPCSSETWRSLRERGRVVHRGEVGVAGRRVGVWLTAVPMSGEVREVAEGVAGEVRGAA